MFRRQGAFFSSLVIVLFLVRCGSGGSSSQNGGNNNPPPQTQGAKIAIVVLENTDYDLAIGNSAMPWLNQLAQSNALATNYFANTHPSIGNYFMMTTGQTVTNDDSFDFVVSADNLVRQFAKDNKQWRVYADALPSPGYLGGNTGTYLKRHNPFAYFSDVVSSTAQAANIVPFQQLSADLSAGTLPDYIFIVPDMIHDAHSCPSNQPSCTINDRLATADAWLQANVAPLLNSSAFGNGILVVTFDEASDLDSSHGGGKVATVLAGKGVRTSFQSTDFYQHENLLSLVGKVLNLSAVPAAGQGADSMTSMRQ